MNKKYVHNQVVDFLEKMSRQKNEMSEVAKYVGNFNADSGKKIEDAMSAFEKSYIDVVQSVRECLTENEQKSLDQWCAVFDDLIKHEIPF
jgi:hypothetical protein